MRFLLDTHVLLWTLLESRRLSTPTKDLIRSPDNGIFFSVVSIWEISIKSGAKSEEFALTSGDFVRAAVATGFEPLSMTIPHASAVAELPSIHRDPFDRMLVAQAQTEQMLLLTRDARLGGMVRII